MFNRPQLETSIKKALARSRGVLLSGPRQSGNSTLAEKFLSRQSFNHFDREYPPHAQRLEQAVHTLENFNG
jgi:predicted AAA+ superfamily ATPase